MNGKTQSIPAKVWQEALGVGAKGRKKMISNFFWYEKYLIIILRG